MRAASDGKATTCLSSGEVVDGEKISQFVAPRAAGSISPPHSPDIVIQGTRPSRVRVPQGVTQGMVVSKVQPIYPPDAKAARIQGSVIIGAVIAKDGSIQSERLISGHPLLAPSAMEAVKQWKYRPYLLNGQAVEVDTQVTINFTLSVN